MNRTTEAYIEGTLTLAHFVGTASADRSARAVLVARGRRPRAAARHRPALDDEGAGEEPERAPGQGALQEVRASSFLVARSFSLALWNAVDVDVCVCVFPCKEYARLLILSSVVLIARMGVASISMSTVFCAFLRVICFSICVFVCQVIIERQCN